MTDITFPIPDGMVPPEGASEGSTFEALATLKLMDGALVLLEIDGLPVGGEPPEKPIASTNDEDFISVIGNKFQPAQPPAAPEE
jgi:hypothetical protein